MKNEAISIIIPLYNESEIIDQVLASLKNELENINIVYEIIVVNDGSKDNSAEIVSKIDYVKLINHPYNKGYGAALKTGIANANYDWVLFFDSDGQHQPVSITKLLKHQGNYDMISGDRSKGKYVRPMLRTPGLWILRKIANYLVKTNIPDLNCGLRLIKKSVLEKYLHLMPNGFSMSTTSTLAFIKGRHNVKFVDIEVNKRDEKTTSTVKPSDAVTTLMLILRLIMLFSPLRIFIPVSFVLFLAGAGYFLHDLIQKFNISDGAIFLLSASLIIFLFGLMADQLAAIRREINK